MPKIALGALDIEVDAQPLSGITKYFRGLLALRGTQQVGDALRNLRDTPLKDVPLEEISFGLSVDRDVDAGNAAIEWTIEAGANARIGFFPKPDQPVISDDTFGDGSALNVPADRAYVSLELEARLGSSVGLSAGDVSFGFTGGTTFSTTTFRSFDAATMVRAAVAETLANFQIPGDWEDLLALPDGSAVTVGGAGRLAFTVTGKFSSSVNPLAVTIPVADVDLKVTGGGSVSVGVDAEVSTEYEIRAIRQDRNTLLIGYHRKKTGEIGVAVGARAGVAATAGSFDLAPQLLSAISGSAETDAEFLRKAGLADAQIARIQATVKDAINRKLEASLDTAFRRLRSGEAAFLFRVDIAATDENARSAIRRALDGDLRPLTAGDSLAGVTLLRTITTETWKKSLTLRINLLGIFNYISITELIKEDRVLFEPLSGDIIITDKVVANRISASAINTEADAQKVRKVLYESFLVTATYCGSRLLRSPASITASHTYFELHGKTNRQILQDYVDVPLAMGLPVADEVRDALLQAGPRHGRSALYVETGYDPAVMRSLFFDSSKALRSYDEYTEAGLRALDLLVRAGDENDFRRILVNKAVWQSLEDAGSGDNAHRALIASNPGLPFVSREVIYSDYRLIAFWAKSMVDLGKVIGEIDDFFKANPGGVDRDDKRLNKFRDKLRGRLADMAEKTKAQFGDPWGLVAADLVSGRKAKALARITTDVSGLEVERASVSAAGR